MSTLPPLPPSPVPSIDLSEPPPWRRSVRLRFVHHRPGWVVPQRGRVAFPAMVAGVGLALSLPPWGFWILAFPSGGLLWWRLGGLRPRTRLLAGWLAGLGCFIPGLAWARAFTWPGAIVLIAVEAVFPAVACLVVPARPVLARALAFPAALTLAEALRQTWPFGGLPIGGVFLGQADGPMLALARLGGPLALTGAVYLGGVAVAAIVGAVLTTIRDQRRVRAFAASGLAAPTTVGDTLAGHGVIALVGIAAAFALVGATIIASHAPDGGPSRGTVTAAAVQGGGVRGFRKSQVDPAVVLAAQLAATQRMQQLDGGHAPQLVLWPEDVVSLDSNLDGTVEAASLSSLARSLHTTLVVGITESVSATDFRNEIVAWGPDGRLVDRFEKVHRVPFGEYVPFRGFFTHFADLSSVPLDAIPGTGSGLMTTPAAPLGAMVSFEVFYADRGRPSVRHGAQVLIVPTNTSSYASSQVPTQEIAASEIQATEQGRDLLQAAPTGFSAMVTNRGHLVTRTSLGTQQIVFANLTRRSGWTVYVRYGDGPPLALAGLALLAGWSIAGRKPSSGGSHSDSLSDPESDPDPDSDSEGS